MKTTFDLFCEIKSLNTGVSDDRIWYELDTVIENALKVSPEDRPPVAEEILPDILYNNILEAYKEKKEENETQKEMLKELEEREAEKLEKEMETAGDKYIDLFFNLGRGEENEENYWS